MFFGIQTNWRSPTVYNWSFGIQQKLPLWSVLSVAYVGDVNRHQLQIRDLNSTNHGIQTSCLQLQDPTAPGKPLPANFLRPYVGYGSIQYMEFASNSNYNALQAELTRRFSSGVMFAASYTWSKVLDVADTPSSLVNPVLNYKSRNYGPAIFDRRQKLTLNVIYRLPNVGKSVNWRPAGIVLNGWEVSSILTFSTGAPTPITYSFVTAADVLAGASGAGIDTDRVDSFRATRRRTLARWRSTSRAFTRPRKLVSESGMLRSIRSSAPVWRTWTFPFFRTPSGWATLKCAACSSAWRPTILLTIRSSPRSIAPQVSTLAEIRSINRSVRRPLSRLRAVWQSV